jgi:hypothetical protein
MKRRSRINAARVRPYGGLVPARQRPTTTQNHLVRNINVTIDTADLEAALTVGSVASAIADTGVSVASFVIRKITCYGKLYYNSEQVGPSQFVYIPTNESWSFTGVPGLAEAKLAYVPPISSSGPFSSSQSGLNLLQTVNVATITVEAQVVCLKPIPKEDPLPMPASPDPSISSRVERFNIVPPISVMPPVASRFFSKK